MVHFGAVPAGSVLPIFFDAFAGATGASVTMTGIAITDVEIFKGISMTQRSSDAGVVLLDTDGINIDGITGIHGFSVDTGDDTDAGFYAVGSFFTVVVASVTIDAQTVNFVAATFRLVAAEAVAGKPKGDVDAWLGTACATPSVSGVPEVDLTHVAGATTNVSTLATSVAAIETDTATIDTAAEIAAAVWSADATTYQSQGTFGQAIGDPVSDANSIFKAVVTDATGATMGVDVVALKAETVEILTDTAVIGALGAGLTALPQLPALGLTVGTVHADAANTASSFQTHLAEADHYWNDALLLITSGALVGQIKEIGHFANAGGVITLAADQAFTGIPADNVAFTIINR